VDQVAVVLPGAGSSAEFVRRAFARPLREAGYALVAPAPVPGPDLVAASFRALDAAAAEYGPRLRLVGGVSLGAHTAVRWTAGRCTAAGAASPACGSTPRASAAVRASPAASAAPPARGTGPDAASAAAPATAAPDRTGADRPAATPAAPPAGPIELDGLILALPAWTGAPGAVAAATAASADLVERLGTAAALAAAGTAVGWVAAELAAAWPAYGDGLAASLRAAAAAPGPTLAELAALPVPAGLVTFTDDPLHPAGVAHEWAAAMPRAAVRELPLVAPAAGRSVLATTALAALAAARSG
jgi:pimeloyl-ACP methyl ester carboxylesterase